jgi:hypothetical protein
LKAEARDGSYGGISQEAKDVSFWSAELLCVEAGSSTRLDGGARERAGVSLQPDSASDHPVVPQSTLRQ